MPEEIRKRKRGSRGGKSSKDKEQEGKETIIEDNTALKLKKTRRSKKGKGHLMEQQETGPQIDFKTENNPDYNSFEVESYEVLAPDTRSYFQNIENLLADNDQVESEELEILLENVYGELDGKEIMACTDFECSRIVEKLLRISSDFQIRVFCDRLNGKYHFLFMHQFGSHVVQTLLGLAADIVEREYFSSSGKQKNTENNEGLPAMEELVLLIGEQLEGHWKDLMMNRHASFLVRTFLNVLCGESIINDSQIRSAKSKKYNQSHNNSGFSSKHNGDRIKRAVPPSFTKLLKNIVREVSAFIKNEDLKKMAVDPVANPVLQMLIYIPYSVGDDAEKTHPLINALISYDNSDDFIKTLITDQVGSHMMEKIIERCDKKTLKKIYKKYFGPVFIDLCHHNVANYVVQVFKNFTFSIEDN